VNKVLLSVTFALLFFFIIVHMPEGRAQAIDPLIDSPGKTIGSDFNGDGIHDFIVGAFGNDDGPGSSPGAAYVFFGSSTLSGTKSLGGGQSADVTFLGKAAGDFLGYKVASAGDVNGDGLDDIIMGAHPNNNGAAYVFFGSTTLSGTLELGGGQSADLTVLGKASSDQLGISISGAGDVNGDGFDDIIIGARYNDDGGSGGNTREGAAYIFFGSTTLSGTLELGGGQSANLTVLGKAGSDNLGNSVSGAGDVNGDGFDDVIVIAPYNDDGTNNNAGAVYIFFGSSTLSGTKDLGGGQSADVTILGKAAGDLSWVGRSSGAGDVNGDGFDDIIMGAAYNDDGGSGNEGAAYIFFGSSTLSGTKDLGGGQSADVTILGKAAGDLLGYSVSGAGDVNDDGFDDIILGASHNNDGGGDDFGAAYVFYGASTLSGTKSLGEGQSADLTILGVKVNEYLGASASGLGDINSDGIPDFVIGAPTSSLGGDEGSAYVFYGASTLSGTKSLGEGQSADLTVLGKADNDTLGWSVGGGRNNHGP